MYVHVLKDSIASLLASDWLRLFNKSSMKNETNTNRISPVCVCVCMNLPDSADIYVFLSSSRPIRRSTQPPAYCHAIGSRCLLAIHDTFHSMRSPLHFSFFFFNVDLSGPICQSLPSLCTVAFKRALIHYIYAVVLSPVLGSSTTFPQFIA